jgi:hypothetical protein
MPGGYSFLCCGRYQYKGRKNFWSIGRSHLENNGITQQQEFPASHHFPGPWDNAGKAPRAKMKKMEEAESERVYDYSKCLEFCEKHMAKPSSNDPHKGTWGCNGNSTCMDVRVPVVCGHVTRVLYFICFVRVACCSCLRGPSLGRII